MKLAPTVRAAPGSDAIVFWKGERRRLGNAERFDKFEREIRLPYRSAVEMIHTLKKHFRADIIRLLPVQDYAFV